MLRLLVMLLGGAGVVLLDGALLVSISAGLVGLGLAAFMTAYTTIPGELPGADADFYAGAVAIIGGIAFMITFLIPYPYEAIVNAGGSMGTALLCNLIPGAISLVISFFIMETGPKGKYARTLKESQRE